MEAARKQIVPLEDPWMSLPQAAAALRCTRYLVSQFIGRGHLRANLVAGRTYVLREDVERLQAEREASAAAIAAGLS